MLEVHAPHEPIKGWKDFAIHIATIVIGLLIAIALEQTVEALHRHHQAEVARTAIANELQEDLKIVKQNQQVFVEQRQQLMKNLDTLESASPDAETIAALHYVARGWPLRSGAWGAAKINGSLALLPLENVQMANLFYQNHEEQLTTWMGYFTDIGTASALVEHAGAIGRLSPAVRQQLLVLTASALGQMQAMISIGLAEKKHIEDAHWEEQ